MPREEATNLVYGMTKTGATTGAAQQRALAASLQKNIKGLEDKLLLTPADQRPAVVSQILQQQAQLDRVLGEMGGAEPQVEQAPQFTLSDQYMLANSRNAAAGKINQQINPPTGYKNTGRTSGGKPVFINSKGKYWMP